MNILNIWNKENNCFSFFNKKTNPKTFEAIDVIVNSFNSHQLEYLSVTKQNTTITLKEYLIAKYEFSYPLYSNTEIHKFMKQLIEVFSEIFSLKNKSIAREIFSLRIDSLFREDY